MKRILKRFLFPTIITVLVIVIFCLLALNGGQYDDLIPYTTYQLMLGANYKNTAVEFFAVNPLGIIVIILLSIGALISWFDFKFDKFVVSGIFCLLTIFIMLLPVTVNKTETAKYLLQVIEAKGDGFMTILAGVYTCAAITLVISCFALFKGKFNSIFKISK